MASHRNGLPFPAKARGLLLLDLLALMFCFALAFAWKYGFPIADPNDENFFRAYLALLPLRVFLYALFGLYRTDLDETILDLAYRVFWVCIMASGLEFLVLLGIRNYYLPHMGVPGRLVISLGVAWGAAATLLRELLGHLRRRLRARISRVLFVGSGRVDPVLFHEVKDLIAMGHSVIGFAGKDLELPEAIYPVLGDEEAIPALLKEHRPSQLVVVDDRMSRRSISLLLGHCQTLGIPVRILPSLYEIMIGQIRIARTGGIPLVDVLRPPMSPVQEAVKRGLDLVLASLAFLAVFWVWLVIYLFVRLDQEGPALDRLECMGRGGKRFHLLRFRCYTKTVFSDGAEIARPTPIGYLLRRLEFDRMPQLFNVIAGDLSLVGPRPMTPDFFESILNEEPLYRHCLSVKPGVTGLAQIHGKRHNMASKLRYDLSYINNCSILLDLKILFQTFSVLITGRKIKG